MESSELGRAVCDLNTSDQWTLVSGVVSKVNRNLPVTVQVSAKSLFQFLSSFGADELRANGIWLEGVGDTALICVNPAFRRARAKSKESKQDDVCVCRDKDNARSTRRYFGSHDYNAGRHASTQSQHKRACILWTPATSGHLHSWRRGAASSASSPLLRISRSASSSSSSSAGRKPARSASGSVGAHKLTRSGSSSSSISSSSLGKVQVDADSSYWAYTTKQASRTDLGHKCRECKQAFSKLGETIAVRRGGRIELRYHSQCFSGTADPRTQGNSSAQSGHWKGLLPSEAPKDMYRKMRTTSHF